MIRFNPDFDSPDRVKFDDEGNPIAIEPNPNFIERNAEQWIAYQIGQLSVEDQTINFVIDDSAEDFNLDVTYKRHVPAMQLSTSYTYPGQRRQIVITYPIQPQQRWQDVPVHLANGRDVYVTQLNDKGRTSERILAQILVKAKPRKLFYSTLDRAVSIDPTTLEVTNIFGWQDDERNLLSARVCDRMAESRLLANDSPGFVV